MAGPDSQRVLMGSRRATITVPAENTHIRLYSAQSLSALPAEALANAHDIAVLHASHNKLRDLFSASAASALTRLEELHVGWNLLSAAPSVSLQALTVLSMPHNNLCTIPPDLPLLFPRLRVLDLSRNKLSALPPRTHFCSFYYPPSANLTAQTSAALARLSS